jgi:hypothetical protein
LPTRKKAQAPKNAMPACSESLFHIAFYGTTTPS